MLFEKSSYTINEKIDKSNGIMVIIEDMEINIAVLKNVFSKDFKIYVALDEEDGIRFIKENYAQITVILLDFGMPKLNGFEVLKRLRSSAVQKKIPIFLITSDADSAIEEKANKYEISGFIIKPFDVDRLKTRVINVAKWYRYKNSLEGINEQQTVYINHQNVILQQVTQAIISSLCKISLFDNSVYKLNKNRFAQFCNTILQAYSIQNRDFNLTQNEMKIISESALLHDIGMISIPEKIHNKPFDLNEKEMDIVRGHCLIGEDIITNLLENYDKAYLNYARQIARLHHERIDGNGYPFGKKEDEIPVWVQLVSIIDCLDSLITPRAYAPAYTLDVAIYMINNGECGKFSEKVLSALNFSATEFLNFISKNNLNV